MKIEDRGAGERAKDGGQETQIPNIRAPFTI